MMGRKRFSPSEREASRDERETALDWLERAVEFGWNDPEFMRNDRDLAPVAAEKRFQELLPRISGGAPAGEQAGEARVS
jgi:hypothetical protein